MLTSTGQHLLESFNSAGRAVILGWRAILSIGSTFRVRSQIITQLDLAGFGSLGVLCLITGLTGMILVMALGPTFEYYQMTDRFGAILAGTFCRELGPIWAAIIILARVGSAMAAELGTMSVNEEIDALRVMDIDPVRYLVLPRVIALVLVMPILVLVADMAGLLGGAIVVSALYDQPIAIYFEHVKAFLTYGDVAGGLIKSAVFGLVIAIISCDQGLNVRGGAESVGRSTTAAVRLCVIFVLLANLVLTSIFVRSGL